MIGDDPIIRCIERTGYAPWNLPKYDDYDDCDEELEWEHDDYTSCFAEPFAVYERNYD